jgi:Protein of unknown function (DUF3703)
MDAIMHMNAAHHELLSRELSKARELIREAKYENAFRHLERAHVLGQTQVRWHVISHWLMLEVALHRGQMLAALGQVVRMVLGAVGSALGRVPVGNTGGSDVSMFRRMPIPPDLSTVMEHEARTTSESS